MKLLCVSSGFACLLAAAWAEQEQACSALNETCDPAASDGDDTFSALSLKTGTKALSGPTSLTTIYECDQLYLSNNRFFQGLSRRGPFQRGRSRFVAVLAEYSGHQNIVTLRLNPGPGTPHCDDVPQKDRAPIMIGASNSVGIQDVTSGNFLYVINTEMDGSSYVLPGYKESGWYTGAEADVKQDQYVYWICADNDGYVESDKKIKVRSAAYNAWDLAASASQGSTVFSALSGYSYWWKFRWTGPVPPRTGPVR